MPERKILVVEDDPTLRMLVQKQVKGISKFETEAVGSGEEAIERFNSDICLIFMDIGLPGIDGCKAAEIIREKELQAGWNQIPIIALTGHADKQCCMISGMTDFILKPVLLKTIEEILHKYLNA